MTANPIIAEIIRGPMAESIHRGAYCVANARGEIILGVGQQQALFYPRSAIKAFQALPLIESGGADRFALTEAEIALCCSSHNGEAAHVAGARSILAKCGASEADLECGAHWPVDDAAKNALIKSEAVPLSIHNNCSGKHAGMIALAKQLGATSKGYTASDHPVQQLIAQTMTRYFEVDVAAAPRAIDGCSVPTWAVPLSNVALGFAKLAQPKDAAGARIVAAVRNNPIMVAGTNRFDTDIMTAVPRLFIKVGAEGVFCGLIPHAGLGFALKCDDGASRGAEVAVAAMLAKLDCWTKGEREKLQGFAQSNMTNWRKLHVGETRANF